MEMEIEMEALRAYVGWPRMTPLMASLIRYLHRHEDPVTGRPLFKPQITRGPKPTAATATIAVPAEGSVPVPGGGAVAGPVVGVPVLHTSRVAARRSRESLAEEARQRAAEEAKLPTEGAFSRGLSASLVESLRAYPPFPPDAALPPSISKHTTPPEPTPPFPNLAGSARLRELFGQLDQVSAIECH